MIYLPIPGQIGRGCLILPEPHKPNPFQPTNFNFNPPLTHRRHRHLSSLLGKVSYFFSNSCIFCWRLYFLFAISFFMEPLIIRNRKITAEDLPIIQAVVNEHWDKGRTHISRELCRHWNWVQPSGRLKDMACRELLLTLHRKGLIDYPPSRFTPKTSVEPPPLSMWSRPPSTAPSKSWVLSG